MHILELMNVTKNFGGLKALNNISAHVTEGEIVGLIGPNGSGKTTLFNLINGFYKPTKGKVVFNGHDITRNKPHEICQMGVGRAFQIVKPFLNLNVFGNVRAAAFNRAKNYQDAEDKAIEVLKFLNLYEKKDFLAMNLTIGERKRLELARALATQPSILLLDEVVAGLNPKETDDLIGLIRRIRDSKVTIFIIEHVMKAMMALSDRIIVIHHGDKIADDKPSKIIRDAKVINAYLGEDVLNARD